MRPILLTLLLFLFGGSSFAQLEWESRASLPLYGKGNCISFTINNKLYVGLGQRPDNTFVKDLWEYDPTTNIWIKKANYPGSGSRHPVAFVIGNKAYVGLGGSSSSRHNDFYEYNPTTNSWTQKTSYPGTARYASGSFVVGDTGFVLAGSCGGTSCYYNDLYMYVPSTNSWTQRANYPGGNVTQPTVFVIDQYAYAGNGLSPSKVLSNAFYRYNKSTNSWTTVASMPGTLRKSSSAFVLDSVAYVGCGSYGSPTTGYTNDFYKYSPASNSWTYYSSNDAFIAREVTQIQVLNDSVVMAGAGQGSYGRLTDFWQLDLYIDSCDYTDTTFVTVYDTTAIEVFDTTFVTIYDTIPVYDTSYVTIVDTSTVTVYDTVYTIVYDTILHLDTSYVTLFDTMRVYLIDTFEYTVYDTLRYAIYDTIRIQLIDTFYRTVDDTLAIYLYDTTSCGDYIVKIYPNPTSTYLNLFSKEWQCIKGSRILIYDTRGRAIIDRKFNSELITIDIRPLARELYFIKLVNKDGIEVFTRKFVVN